MKGLVFTGGSRAELMEFPDPTPGPGEVVVEIKASGMCGSDLKFYRTPVGGNSGLGYTADGPVIAGHEPAGIVVAVGSGVPARQAKIGDRVIIHHCHGCDCCSPCRSGWPQLCDDGLEVVYGITRHGAHAPYMLAAATNLIKLPEELSFVTGAAIACGTGTAFGALRRLDVSGNDTIAIVGQGPVGLSATQLAKAMGARVIALDISPERLARATAFGADDVVNPAEVDGAEAVRELTHGKGATLALDTSGTPAGRLSAIRSTGSWGKVAFVGEGKDVTIDVSKDMLRRQTTIIGHWTFSIMQLAEGAQFVIDRKIAVEDLFTDRWTLAQGGEAYERFDKQSGGKGVFLL